MICSLYDISPERYQDAKNYVDCKTVRIFAYSSKREQSNKRSGTRLKTESTLGRDRYSIFIVLAV